MNVVPNDIGHQSTESSKLHIQINKCLNERHRREQENFYIEELAALITAGSLNEMNSLSVKPDKCAILSETVKQIQSINQQSQSDDLQASEVSSSRPNFMPSDVSSLLLDALNCFLFTLNTDGYIDYVSENVTKFLKFSQSELINKSIFEILHKEDHPLLSSVLLSMAAIGNGLSSNWPSSSSMDQMNSTCIANALFNTSSSSNTSTTSITGTSVNVTGGQSANTAHNHPSLSINSSQPTTSSSSNELSSFNSRFLIKSDSELLGEDFQDDDDLDNDALLDTDTNEAMASDDLVSMLDGGMETSSTGQEQSVKRKKKRHKDGLSSSIPQYESMQVNTVFLSSSNSKQIDSLALNSLTSTSSSVSVNKANSGQNSSSRHLLSPEDGRLLCFARRLPDSEKGSVAEHFTTHLDLTGKVVSIDTSKLSVPHSQFLNQSLVNSLIQEFAHPDDLMRVQSHLKEAMAVKDSPAISKFYRFKVAPDKYVTVQTISKVSKPIIIAKHSIICDSDKNNNNNSNTSSPPSSLSSSASSLTTTSTTSSSTAALSGIPPINSRIDLNSVPTNNNNTSSVETDTSSASLHLVSTCTTTGIYNANLVNTSSSQLANPINQSQSSWSSSNTASMQSMQPMNEMSSSVANPSTCSFTTTSTTTADHTSTGSSVPALNFDDFSDMLSNSWDNFGADCSPSGCGDCEEPTTTVDSMSLTNPSANSPLMPPNSHRVGVTSGCGGSFPLTTSYTDTSMCNSMESGAIHQRQSSITTDSSPSVSFAGGGGDSEDKLRNLLTSSGGTGLISNDEANSFNLSHQPPSQQQQHGLSKKLKSFNSSGSSNSNSNDILRELLDTEDVTQNCYSKISQVSSGGAVINNNNGGNNATASSGETMTSSGVSGCAPSIGFASSFVEMLDDSRSAKSKSTGGSTGSGDVGGGGGSSAALSTTTTTTSTNAMLRMLLNDEEYCHKISAGATAVPATTPVVSTGPSILLSQKQQPITASGGGCELDHLFKEEPNSQQISSLDLNTLLSSSTSDCGYKRKNSFEQDHNHYMQHGDSMGEPKRLASASSVASPSLASTSGPATSSSSSSSAVSQPQLQHHSQPQQSLASSHQPPQLLACQNPMLASMLAKTPTSKPEEKIQIPPSMISSTPDTKLPPNLEKKLLPPPPNQQQPQQSQHMSTLHQASILNIQANSIANQTSQIAPQQMQNIHLQLQQQQPSHHMAQTSVTGGSMTAHVAIKSGVHPSSTIHLRPSNVPQQQQASQMGGNYIPRALQSQQQHSIRNTGSQMQTQPILQPQTSMSVGQQLVQQQQLQQLKQQQMQQSGGQTNFLTQILTTSTGNQEQVISRARLLQVASNNKLAPKSVTISSGGLAVASSSQITVSQPLGPQQQHNTFITSVSNTALSVQQHQQSLLAAAHVSSQVLSPSVSSSTLDIDSDLSQILDEVIEMDSVAISTVAPSIGQPSLSSLLSNAPSANRNPLDDLSLTSTRNELPQTEQYAISEICKNLMSIEQQAAAAAKKATNQTATPIAQASFNSQPPTPQSPRLPNLQSPQLGPPPNYQTSVPPPPSYPSAANFNQMNAQVSNQNFALNRMPQSQSSSTILMNAPRGMAPRGQTMQRPPPPGIPSQSGQSGNLPMGTYLPGSQPNKLLLEQQKRLLLQQSHQQLVPQSQQPDNCNYPDNIKDLLNSSVVPNAQITIKARPPGSNTVTVAGPQQPDAQLSPCYAVGGNTTTMQVPSTPVLPQSPVPGSQLSPGPGNTPGASAPLRNVAAAYQPPPNTVYPSPQATSAPSPFTASNRMSPGHFVGNNGAVVSSAASPSPVPPVSPLVQQIASPQQSSGQSISWQQQASPASRLSSNVPSPQVMSPSSTATSVPGMAPLVSIQQKTNPMLNAQLSAGVQRFQHGNGGRPIRMPQQGPRSISLRPPVTQATYNLQQQQSGGSDQFIGGQNIHVLQHQRSMQQQQQMRLQQQKQQQQRMIFSNNRMAFMGQQQQGAAQMGNSFSGMSNNNLQSNQQMKMGPNQSMSSDSFQPVTNSQSVMFSQQMNNSSVQMGSMDSNSLLANYDMSPQQQAFSIEMSAPASTGQQKSTSDFVRQELRRTLERSNQHHQQGDGSSPQSQSQMMPGMNSVQQSNMMNPNLSSLQQQQQRLTPTNSLMEFDGIFDTDFDTASPSDSLNNNSINIGLSTPNSNQMSQLDGGGGGVSISRSNSLDNPSPSDSKSLLQQLLSTSSER